MMKTIFRKILTANRILQIYLSRYPEIRSERAEINCLSNLDVVIHAHVYNPNYIKKLAKGIKNFPNSLFLISVPNSGVEKKVLEVFHKKKQTNIKTEIVPNRGRNFGPMLNVFSEEILRHEILIHIHSKASNGMTFRFFWGRILWRDLYLSRKKIKNNSLFFTDPKVGVLSTFSLAWTPPVFGWGGSFRKAEILVPGVTSRFKEGSIFLYPIGGMFWARVSAIRPIFEEINSYDKFPEEHLNMREIRSGQTTEHVLERLIGIVPETLGFSQIIRVHERRRTILAKEFIDKLVASESSLKIKK